MEEYLDLVDENDVVIGRESRDIIYEKGLSNFRAVDIFIFNSEGKIITPKRSMNRRIFPGCYDFSVSGYVDSGESYIDAAYREMKEELGITNVTLKEVGYYSPYKYGLACFVRLYMLTYNGEINYDKDGIDSIHYFSADDLRLMIKENPKQFKGDFPKVLEIFTKNNSTPQNSVNTGV